jgi:AcrR family transcriptional regulator
MVAETAGQLVNAAARLLDEGGLKAVTVRAVASLVGVSHNAPYRHFEDRNALLAAVAEMDLRALEAAFQRAKTRHASPLAGLRAGIAAFIAYGRKHPARYRLLFSDPELASRGGTMEVQGLRTFAAFGVLVHQCQADATLSANVETKQLTALLYATLHGLVDLELGGRARPAKGLGDIETIVALVLRLLGQPAPTARR